MSSIGWAVWAVTVGDEGGETEEIILEGGDFLTMGYHHWTRRQGR